MKIFPFDGKMLQPTNNTSFTMYGIFDAILMNDNFSSPLYAVFFTRCWLLWVYKYSCLRGTCAGPEQFVYDIRHGFMPKFWLHFHNHKNPETDFFSLLVSPTAMIDGIMERANAI